MFLVKLFKIKYMFLTSIIEIEKVERIIIFVTSIGTKFYYYIVIQLILLKCIIFRFCFIIF